MIAIKRIGKIKHLWGESLRWDDRRERLYFVDSAALKLHWLDHGSEVPGELTMPSLPTGVVLTESGLVLVALEDGLYLVDPDRGSLQKFVDNPAPPPEPRLNDAQADPSGNLVTGSLGFTHNPVGAYWWLSAKRDEREGRGGGEWREHDPGVSDANGPIVRPDGHSLLVVDTSEKAVFEYPYDGALGEVGQRRVLIDTTQVAGGHDGATLDTEGRYWSAMVGGSRVIAVSANGEIDHEIELPVDYPTSLAFGGPLRNRLYVTSVSLEFGPTKPVAPDAGALLEITGLDATGELEPRFAF